MKQQKQNKNLQRNDEIIGSSFTVINQLLKVASTLIGLVTVVYIIGYFRLTSYYNCFNSKWIINNISPLDFISASIFSISVISIILLLGITDVAEGLSIKSLYNFLKISILLTILISIISEITKGKIDFKITIGLLYIASFLWAIASGIMITIITQLVRLQKFKWSSNLVFSLLFAIAYGLYFSPRSIGKSEGYRDSNLKHSKLPYIRLINDENINWRLLYARYDLLYLVKLDSVYSEMPAIKIVNYTEINSIRGNKQ